MTWAPSRRACRRCCSWSFAGVLPPQPSRRRAAEPSPSRLLLSTRRQQRLPWTRPRAAASPPHAHSAWTRRLRKSQKNSFQFVFSVHQCRHHLSRVHPYRVGVQSEPGCSSPFYLPTYQYAPLVVCFLSSTNTALVSSPSLAVLHLPTYLPTSSEEA